VVVVVVKRSAGQRVNRERRDQCGQQKIILSELAGGGHGKAGSVGTAKEGSLQQQGKWVQAREG
jgi:hypothetical protein